jgi:hypothetical protein
VIARRAFAHGYSPEDSPTNRSSPLAAAPIATK